MTHEVTLTNVQAAALLAAVRMTVGERSRCDREDLRVMRDLMPTLEYAAGQPDVTDGMGVLSGGGYYRTEVVLDVVSVGVPPRDVYDLSALIDGMIVFARMTSCTPVPVTAMTAAQVMEEQGHDPVLLLGAYWKEGDE